MKYVVMYENEEMAFNLKTEAEYFCRTHYIDYSEIEIKLLQDSYRGEETSPQK